MSSHVSFKARATIKAVTTYFTVETKFSSVKLHVTSNTTSREQSVTFRAQVFAIFCFHGPFLVLLKCTLEKYQNNQKSNGQEVCEK